VKYFKHDSHRLKALDGVNLKIEDGEFVCLVGPSGCGKSTFLRIVAGLEKPDEGEILFDGKPVKSTGPERIIVFQEGALFPWLKVQDNVEFGLKMAGIPKEERSQISKRYLDMMQLTKFADSYTYQLSTGMKQRVAIARALVMDPDVLLMDEPFAALDPQTRDLLLVEMQLIWEKTKKTILFVTHNIGEATVLGTKIAIFSNRPSSIKKTISVNYKRPRLIEDQNLLPLQQEILTELRPEVKKS
jgi:NitT/TauT family transport system ATP-binding protein